MLDLTAVLAASVMAVNLLAPGAAEAVNTHPIEGYAGLSSVEPGQPVEFYVSLPKNVDGVQRTSYTVEYLRFGATGGVAPVSMLGPLPMTNGANQAYTSTSYATGAGWTESFELTIPLNWPSGIYAARIVDVAEPVLERKDFYIGFMVRDAVANRKPVALLTSTNTYQAYNFWPGEAGADDGGAFYPNCAGGNERTAVSFERPAPSAMPVSLFALCGPDDPNVTYPRTGWRYLENVRTDHLAAGDVRVARWLANEGLAYSVITDWDLDRDWAADQRLDLLDPAVTPTLVIGVHNEYWSRNMYDAVDRYLRLGGNVLNLSGNALYWTVTLTVDPATGGRTMRRGAYWGHADRERLLGIGDYNNVAFPYCHSNLAQLSTSHWAYRQPLAVPTGVLMGDGGEMKTPAGECVAAGNRAKAVGWELDYADVRFARGWTRLAGLPGTPDVVDVLYFQRPSGGSVFGAGSITFAQSLMHDAANGRVLTALVRNVLSRMSRRTFSDFSAADANHPGSTGQPDVLTRRQGESALRIYHGQGDDAFEAGGGQPLTTAGWGGYDEILPVGDFDSDGDADLVARDAGGELHLYRGNHAGGFEAGTGGVIDAGWGTFNALLAPGDWDGDGNPDLLARTAGGDLRLYRGTGAGALQPGSLLLRSGMNGLTLAAVGDFDYDAGGPGMVRTPGQPDLLARLDGTGELRLYHGTGTGFEGGFDVINQGWGGMRLIPIGDFDGDSHPDVLGCVSGTNQLRAYHGTGGGLTLAGYLRAGYTVQGAGWACDTTRFAGVW